MTIAKHKEVILKMLGKIMSYVKTKIIRNPVVLFAVLASLAAAGVGSAFAFNAMALSSPDADHYEVRTFDYFAPCDDNCEIKYYTGIKTEQKTWDDMDEFYYMDSDKREEYTFILRDSPSDPNQIIYLYDDWNSQVPAARITAGELVSISPYEGSIQGYYNWSLSADGTDIDYFYYVGDLLNALGCTHYDIQSADYATWTTYNESYIKNAEYLVSKTGSPYYVRFDNFSNTDCALITKTLGEFTGFTNANEKNKSVGITKQSGGSGSSGRINVGITVIYDGSSYEGQGTLENMPDCNDDYYSDYGYDQTPLGDDEYCLNSNEVTFTPNGETTAKEIVAWQAGSVTFNPGDYVQYSELITPSTGYTFDDSTGLNFTVTLVPLFETPAPTYTVTYHSNYDPDSTYDDSYIPAGDYSVLANGTSPGPDFSRTGYSFDKWTTDAAGTTPAGASITISGNTDLYAQWKNNYTLHYVANLAEVSNPEDHIFHADDANISEGKYTFPNPSVSKSGYNFLGWSVTNGSEVANTTIDFESGTYEYTVYGVWYNTVTYNPGSADGNAVSGTPEVYNIITGKSHSVIDNPFTAPTGYHFNGWSLTSPASGYAVSGDITVNENVTYEATWAKNTHTVTYQDKDGNVLTSPAQATYSYNDTVTVAAVSAMPDVTGYNKTEWSVVSGGVTFNSGERTFSMPDEDVVLRADYTVAVYNVSYEATGDVPSGWTAPASHSGTYNTTVNTQPVPAYDTDRYSFIGWTVKSGSPTDVTVHDGCVKSFTMPAGDVELTGTFTENPPVTLQYDANRGASEIISELTKNGYTQINETIADLPSGYSSREGYTFANQWSTSPNGGTVYSVGDSQSFTTDTTLYAVWTENSYSLDYQDGGKTGATIPADVDGLLYTAVKNGYALSTVQPTVSGYSFRSWLVNGTEYAAGATIPFSAFDNSGTAVAVAQWDNWTYHIVYEKGAGHDSAANMPANSDHLYGDVHLASSVRISSQRPTDSGYTFTGWSVAKKSGTVFIAAADLDNNAVNTAITDLDFPDGTLTITATAQWDAIPTYTVTYSVTSSEPDSGAYTLPVDSTAYHAGDTVTVAAELSVDGYTFDGWKKDGSKVDTFTMPAGNVTLTGTFTANKHNVTYTVTGDVPSGYSVPAAQNNVSFDTEVTVEAAPSVAGYTFSGWTTDDAAVSGGKFSMPDKDVTLTGTFTATSIPSTYTVHYVGNGSDGHYTDVSVKNDTIPADEYVSTFPHKLTGERDTAIAPLSTDSKFDFVCWCLTPQHTEGNVRAQVTKADFDDYGTAGVLNVYAVWIKHIDVTYNKGVTEDDNTPVAEDIEQVFAFKLDVETLHYRVMSIADLGEEFGYDDHELDYWVVVANAGVITRYRNPSSGGSYEPRRSGAGSTETIDVGGKLYPGDVVDLTGNVKLKAAWREKQPVTLTYKANGGTPASAVPNSGNPIGHYVGDEVTVQDGNSLKNGEQVFRYWSTTANDETGSKHYKPNDKFTINADTVLYAIYDDAPGSGDGSGSGNEYTVTYDKNGGTGSEPKDSNKYSGGETVNVADKGNLAKNGCTFKEWNTKPNGTGTGFKGDGTDTFIMPESNVTLYAIWLDSQGNIVSPGTGESDMALIIAFNALMLSLLTVAFVAIRHFRIHKEKA